MAYRWRPKRVWCDTPEKKAASSRTSRTGTGMPSYAFITAVTATARAAKPIHFQGAAPRERTALKRKAAATRPAPIHPMTFGTYACPT